MADADDFDDDDVDDEDEGHPEPEVTIEISGLSLFTHVGVTAAEREVGQRLLLDLRIDVDVLLLGSLEHSSQRLTLPHPEVLARRFVLVPLLELDPELTLPGGERAADALGELPGGQAVRRVGDPLVGTG